MSNQFFEQPILNSPYEYPKHMLGDLERAKIVITNYHAFKLRERIDLSKGGRSLLQGRGEELNTLVVEIKGYRREDAKEKKSTMENYWVPGVNNLGQYGRWDFAEFTEVYEIASDFESKVEQKFIEMIDAATAASPPTEALP